MLHDPEPLHANHTLEGFTPDAALAWLAAYAGPCDNCEEKHTKLYLMPVIGWFHVKTADAPTKLRPAVMSIGGVIRDYIEVMPSEYRFIAIVPYDDNAATMARDIYRERVGAEIKHMPPDEPPSAN